MYFEDNHNKIYYEKYGNKKDVIIILPGWGFTRPTFNYLIDNLSKSYTIYILDYPEFGKSILKKQNQTIYDYASTIRSFIKNNKINNPTIIAHSFGGRITTLLCGYYKVKIKRLILIDIATIKPKKTIIQKLKTLTFKILKRIYMPEKLFKFFASSDYATLPINLRTTFKNIINEDLTPYLKYINQKTLIIWGQNDKSTPLKDAYKIRKEIKNSELIIYKSASHYSYLDYPYLTLRIIEEYLKEKET